MIHLVTGGARSGKSSYAQGLAQSYNDKPAYIATAKVWDKEFEARVERHKKDRQEQWQSMEVPVNISQAEFEGNAAVVDCLTLWASNIFSECNQDVEKSLEIAIAQIDLLHVRTHVKWFLVTNEIGMGLHGDSELSRKFIDLQGWINQAVAKRAEEVTFMVSGIPLSVKSI